MVNKQILTTVVVAIVSAVIASIATVNVMGGSLAPIYYPIEPTPIEEVNAHKCQADETCEVNLLSGHGTNNTVGIIRDLDVGEDIYADGKLESDHVYTNYVSGNFGYVGSHYSNVGMIIRSAFDEPMYFRVPGGAPGDDITIVSNGNVTINSLSGNGKAYVCIDNDGTLYRSISSNC